MGYLLQQIFWYVLVAFLLGVLVGWWMGGRGAARRLKELEERIRALTGERDGLRRELDELRSRLATQDSELAELRSRLAECEADLEARSHRHSGTDVEEIEGIGTGFGHRLKAEGIHTVEQLLELCGTDEGVERVRAIVDLDTHTVHTWAIMADLMRIRGLGGQWAELLWRAGVTSVQDLASREAGALEEHLQEVNVEEHRVHELPGEKRLHGFIQAARELPRAIPDRPGLSG